MVDDLSLLKHLEYPHVLVVLSAAATLTGLLLWNVFGMLTQQEKQQRETKSGPHNPQLEPSWMGPQSKDFLNAPYEQAGLINVQGRQIPWTCTAPDYGYDELSYTVSCYAHYIGYGFDEIDAYLSGTKRRIARAIMSFLGWIAQVCRYDEIIQFNNFLLSTNLWPGTIQWSANKVDEINQQLLCAVPNSHQKALVWRSIDALSHPDLHEVLLKETSCLLIPCRIINWVDYSQQEATALKTRSLKRDLKIFREKVGWNVVSQTTVSESTIYELVTIDADSMSLEIAQNAVQLYNQLYLDKYSRRNPQFTPQGVYRMVMNGFLKLEVIRERAQPQRMVVVVGWWCLDNVTTGPLSGYLVRSEDHTLYRLLSVIMYNVSKRTGISKRHQSGGANSYKRLRGALSTVECIAVFIDHLPFYQRWGWRICKKVGDTIITVDRATKKK